MNMTVRITDAVASATSYVLGVQQFVWDNTPKRGIRIVKQQEAERAIPGLASLSNDGLRKMAEKSKPPQSWYDEDMTDLY